MQLIKKCKQIQDFERFWRTFELQAQVW